MIASTTALASGDKAANYSGAIGNDDIPKISQILKFHESSNPNP